MWDEVSAWKVLCEHFWEHDGNIYVNPHHKATDIETEAIKYLCEEWDYSFVHSEGY